MKKNVKPRREPPKIYRIGTGVDTHTSPESTEAWLVQANSVTEAFSKAVAKMKWMESAERLTIEPLGTLSIK